MNVPPLPLSHALSVGRARRAVPARPCARPGCAARTPTAVVGLPMASGNNAG